MSEFSEKQIAKLMSDVAVIEEMQERCDGLNERNSEAGTGSCLLEAVSVLLAAAKSHYLEAVKDWKPEVSA